MPLEVTIIYGEKYVSLEDPAFTAVPLDVPAGEGRIRLRWAHYGMDRGETTMGVDEFLRGYIPASQRLEE